MICRTCHGDKYTICGACLGTRIEPAPPKTTDPLRTDITSAAVLRIGERYFYGFTKTGRPKTAWSLAGAQMFRPPHNGTFCPKMAAVLRRLEKYGRSIEVMIVKLDPSSLYPGSP